MNKHSRILVLEYNYITDGIYIGANQCCQTHFDEKLKREEIDADISLEAERVDMPFGVNFYIWIPIKNHTAPTQEQFEFGVSVLEKLVSMKKKSTSTAKMGMDGRRP